jgi:hypothetical protein
VREYLATFLQQLEDGMDNLTLGELVVVYETVDFKLNSQLDLSPISDTMDLRSCNIRKETIFHES